MKTIYSLLLFLGLCLNSFAQSNWTEVFNKSGIKIYASKKVDGLIPFKALGTINHPIEKVVELLNNYKIKNKWAPKLKEVVLHKMVKKDHYVFSEYYKTPWPAYDREFLLEGSLQKVGEKYIFDAKSSNEYQYANSDYVQADVKKLTLILSKIENNKTHISFEFFGDIKGWIPTWLVNIIQKKWPYRFIQAMDKQLQDQLNQ